MTFLLREHDFKIAYTYGRNVACVGKIVDLVSWTCSFATRFQVLKHVVAIQMYFEIFVSSLIAVQKLFFNAWNARGCQKGRHPIHVVYNSVYDFAFWKFTGPPHQSRNTKAAFPSGCFFAMERGLASIRPSKHFCTVVRGVENDGVVGYPKFVEFIEKLANMTIVFNHSIRV